MRGEVVEGMTPDSPAATGRRKTRNGFEQDLNGPMMPIAWTRSHTNDAGKTNRIFTTTMGSATDLLNEGFRRMLVNSVYWATDLTKVLPQRVNVEFVGPYKPSNFGFDGFRKGVKPADLGGLLALVAHWNKAYGPLSGAQQPARPSHP
jgi:hypothetical protein